MTYQQSIDYLLSFTNLELKPGQSLTKKDFDLKNITLLLQLMGNPHYLFKSVHVAGSKGKGSTSALIELGLRSSGKKTGLYTSPHLIDYTERFRIDGQSISKIQLTEAISYLKTFIEKVPGIQTFEIMTALAFHIFAANHVDWAVIEVGLGGRLDATNVLLPELSVITPIYKEHTHVLGDTIEEIAFEKAGIIKPNIPIITSFQPYPAAKEVILKAATDRNAPCLQADDKVKILRKESIGENQKFEYKGLKITTPLLGDHQLINIQTAFAALKIIGVSNEHLMFAAENISWPGRFQQVKKGDQTFIFDVAHIPEAMQYGVNTYKKYFDKKAVVIIGVSSDKDVTQMTNILKPITDTFILTKSSHPRALASQKLFNSMKDDGADIISTNSLREALSQEVVKIADIILITGSFFVVGDAMKVLEVKVN